MGTKKMGLPTAIDDEVLVALIQVSKAQGFPKKVKFSRYELINILGWDHSGKSYQRIKEAIQRWQSISLDYENAWRTTDLNGEESAWVDASFHIIDWAEFSRLDDKASPDECSFSWGDYIQKSFDSGSIKKLNFLMLREFKTGIAKRIYRFLDRRFWHKSSWRFDLKEFALEKVGMSRNLNVGQMKQKLVPALYELAMADYILLHDEEIPGLFKSLQKDVERKQKQLAATKVAKTQARLRLEIQDLEQKIKSVKNLPTCPGSRYEKARVGEWFISFTRRTKKKAQLDLEVTVESLPALEARLVKCGVTAAQAKRLAKEHDHEIIQERIELLEFLIAKGGGAAPRNPAGWLVKAIRENYEAPPEFKSTQQKLREAAKRKEKQLAKDLAQKEKVAEMERLRAEKEAQDARIENYLAELSKTERSKIERQAKEESEKAGFGLGLTEDSPLTKHYVQETIKEMVLKELGETAIEVPEK